MILDLAVCFVRFRNSPSPTFFTSGRSAEPADPPHTPKIRRPTRHVVVHASQPHPRVHRDRTRPQLKIEIHRLIQRPRIRTRRRHLHEHIKVDQHAVLVLTCRVAEFLQSLESSPLASLSLQLRLLLRRQPPGSPGKFARMVIGGVLHSNENIAPSLGRNPL